jgi:hypothetical protein
VIVSELLFAALSDPEMFLAPGVAAPADQL